MARDRQAVSELAYLLWQRRGSPPGSAELDWNEAERQLAEQDQDDALDEALKETFPASDPPASSLPDEPSVNAKKKRRVAASAPKSRKS